MAVGKGAQVQDLERNQRTAEEPKYAAMEEPDDIEAVPASATCTFVGEGRANLVFTLTGVDGHSSFQGLYIHPPLSSHLHLSSCILPR